MHKNPKKNKLSKAMSMSLPFFYLRHLFYNLYKRVLKSMKMENVWLWCLLGKNQVCFKL